MRYGRLFAFVLVLSLPAMACRRPPADGAAAGGPPGAPVKIGVAIDSGTSEDEARKALVLAGLREAARSLQGRVADDPDRTDFGDRAEFRLVESRVRGEDREQLLRVLAEQGCALVCGIGQGYAEAAAKVAKDHPGQRFAVIDAVIDTASDSGRASLSSAAASNICFVSFAEAEGSFLAGALAGLVAMEKPGAKVGFMGGMDDAATHRYEAGFIAGAASVNAALRRPGMILVQYCGRDARALEDPAMASAIAQDMYRAGAEIVYHDAGASSAGLFAVAGSQGKLAIGADLDQGYAETRRGAGNATSEAAFAILSSMEKRLDRAVLLLAREAVETGTVRSGVRILGLAEGGMGLAVNEANRARLEPYSERLEMLAASVSAGGIRVPADDSQATQFLKDLR